MDTTDKTFSNVDKGTAEILKEAKLVLQKEGYVVSKPREKSIARELMNAAYANAFKTMSKDPDLTVRKICMKAIEDKFFDECLDTLFKGKIKRAAFDNKAPKPWSEKFQAANTVTKDITSKGQFKRFKLIERYVNMDMNLTKTLLDPDYMPVDKKIVVKKREYKKKK
jgi:hypothetical protein|tara:strand:- start:138 stop:638 length:501 start_codon:yes stop_codon:yes gene_type:complete